MNATAGIIIAIGAVVVLAALAFVTLARRSDVRGARHPTGAQLRDPGEDGTEQPLAEEEDAERPQDRAAHGGRADHDGERDVGGYTVDLSELASMKCWTKKKKSNAIVLEKRGIL